jgi:N-acetylneuraminate synthase
MRDASSPGRTLVIAEAGVNHNGSLDLALQLVDVAARSGADVVKFQTFKAEKLATSMAAKAAYQVDNTGEAGSQLAMLRRLELAPEHHHVLVERCRARGIRFMSTGFDADSLAFLSTLDMPAVKIPSGDITAAPLLLQAARIGLPVILSSGMSSLADIEAALGVLAFGLTSKEAPRNHRDFAAAFASAAGQEALRTRVTLLHCTTQYPAPAESVNLRAMDTMAAAFGLPVGYSDHTAGIEVSIAAVARGAVVIEKHFTLDRTLPGPDHAASLEPDELARMVSGIRTIERVFGDGRKHASAAEVPNVAIARRSLVAARTIRAGEIITAEMLGCKRPGTGVSPLLLWDCVGRPSQRNYNVDDAIEL